MRFSILKLLKYDDALTKKFVDYMRKSNDSYFQ